MINKKKVLGRGLGALIGEASAERHVPAAASAVNEKFFFCYLTLLYVLRYFLLCLLL